MPQKVVALVSGGIDSVVALYQARQDCQIVAALSFNYGSKHNHKEIPCAAWHCSRLQVPHQVINLDFIGQLFQSSLLQSGGAIPDGHYEHETMQQTVVPFRNGIFLSVAGGYAESMGAHGLIIGAHAGDRAIYPDCREAFMESMTEALRQGTYAQIEILRPFIAMTKAQIVSRGHELKVDFTQTWSCYNGGEIHCGTCGTCVERREAFIEAKLADPTVYASADSLPTKPEPAAWP
jgi:7-cyano-7-deazaguanine synthase